MGVSSQLSTVWMYVCRGENTELTGERISSWNPQCVLSPFQLCTYGFLKDRMRWRGDESKSLIYCGNAEWPSQSPLSLHAY